MNGLEAYKTFLGMGLHYRGNIDGWKYNFSGKCKPETFAAKKRLVYMFAKIEREHPTKLDQIKFFYPAFNSGYVKPDAVSMMYGCHGKFLKDYGFGLVAKHKAWLEGLRKDGAIQNFFDLFACDEMLPKFYQLAAEKHMTHGQAVVLCLCVPELLNTVVSNEPIVFEAWKVKLEFDMKFMQLYISGPLLRQLKDATVEAFKNSN